MEITIDSSLIYELIGEIKALRAEIRLINAPSFITVQQATREFNMSAYTIRVLCDNGSIPSTLSEGSSAKKKHWLIDRKGAIEALRNKDLNQFRKNKL